MMNIRVATTDDISQMIGLSDQMRTRYEQYSPVFWRKAEDASEKQTLFFQAQLQREQNLVLIAEEAGRMEGLLIASIVNAPPVYAPGGKVCMIDDFAVSAPEIWQTVGQALLTETLRQAKARGAVLSVVVCGHLDEFKREMLRKSGSTIASEWYVQPII